MVPNSSWIYSSLAQNIQGSIHIHNLFGGLVVDVGAVEGGRDLQITELG